MTTAPPQPWTAAQRAKLCTLLKQRGLWDERRVICGVASLSELTRDQAAQLISRLDGPPRAGGPASGRSFSRNPWALIVTFPRSTALASQQQLDALAKLLAAVQRVCGWSDELVAGWLWQRKRIKWSSAANDLDRRLASQLISELSNILDKGRGASPSRRSEPTAPAVECSSASPASPRDPSPEHGGSHVTDRFP